MKKTPTTIPHQHMMIRNLSISTNIQLHPDFVSNPRAFVRRRKVDLADVVFPETDFRQAPDDPYHNNRIERTKFNIHLVRHGAIRLFTERDGDSDWIRSIDLNPSILLHDAKRRVLAAGELLLSLKNLRDKVTPLLASPPDARHIVPGLAQDGEPLAYWSEVDSEFLFPEIDIRCLHGLSHPLTGSAEGAKPDRIQLGDKKDDRVIRTKKAKWEIEGADGLRAVEGIRVRLILKGRALTDEFLPFATMAKVKGCWRVVAFSEAGPACVHQSVMSRIEGTFLPVPVEWRSRSEGKKHLTHAKAMALVSHLTSIPVAELRTMDQDIRHPSESTRKRLNKELPIEFSRLAPVPLATLFQPSAYASGATGIPRARGNIDPDIAAAYGPA